MEIEVRYTFFDGGSRGFETETRTLQWPAGSPVAVDTSVEFRDTRNGADVRGRIIGMTVATYDGSFGTNMTVKQIVELELLEKDADPWNFRSGI